MFKSLLIIALTLLGIQLFSQENSEAGQYLATYGNMAEKTCGDDDFSQSVFFAIPLNFSKDFYIRVFDPDCGGSYDQSNGLWETNTVFEMYGGPGCISEFDARQIDPAGNYKSGILLEKKLFASESEIDGKWVSFGPYNVKQGEVLENFSGYAFFKTIVEGRTGNDGNIYSIFLSSSGESNNAIRNSRIFEYERTYFENNKIYTERVGKEILSDNKLSIPVKLELVPADSGYKIIAIPINE